MMMRAVWAAACLLLVLNQYAAAKKDSPEVRRRAVSSILQERIGQALQKSGKRRVQDAIAAKTSPLVRALVDRTNQRYNRDLYENLFGSPRDAVAGFFKEECGFDFTQDNKPVRPEDIKAGSDAMMTFINDLNQQLQDLDSDIDSIMEFYETQDPTAPQVDRNELLRKAGKFLHKVGMQENGLTQEGVCALGGVTGITFRLIEHGTDGFRKEKRDEGESCYNTVTTYWTIMGQYPSAAMIADAMEDGTLLLIEEVAGAVMRDVRCILGQSRYEQGLLEKGMAFDGTNTEAEAWEGTLTVMYLAYAMIVEWGHMRGTLDQFGKLWSQVDQIFKDRYGEDYADTRGIRGLGLDGGDHAGYESGSDDAGLGVQRDAGLDELEGSDPACSWLWKLLRGPRVAKGKPSSAAGPTGNGGKPRPTGNQGSSEETAMPLLPQLQDKIEIDELQQILKRLLRTKNI